MTRYFLYFLLTALLLTAGCSDLDRSSKEKLAASFITAISEDDEDTFWKAFAPEVQEAVIKAAGDDEDKARTALFQTFRKSLTVKYQLKDIENISDDEKILQKIVSDMVSDPGKKFVEIDKEWYIKVDF